MTSTTTSADCGRTIRWHVEREMPFGGGAQRFQTLQAASAATLQILMLATGRPEFVRRPRG